LTPVSTAPGVPVTKFAAGVIDTDGKFATDVVANISANFLTNLNDPNVFFGAWGKMIHEKSRKSHDTVPL
jgi:hypothetical protein